MTPRKASRKCCRMCRVKVSPKVVAVPPNGGHLSGRCLGLLQCLPDLTLQKPEVPWGLQAAGGHHPHEFLSLVFLSVNIPTVPPRSLLPPTHPPNCAWTFDPNKSSRNSSSVTMGRNLHRLGNASSRLQSHGPGKSREPPQEKDGGGGEVGVSPELL